MKRTIQSFTFVVSMIFFGSDVLFTSAAQIQVRPDRNTDLLSGTFWGPYNFGSFLDVGNIGSLGGLRSIVSFDVGAIGTQDITVQSISLQLWFRTDGTYANGTVAVNPEIHAILPANREWEEGTGDSNGHIAANESSWNFRLTGTGSVGATGATPWAGSGGLNTVGVDHASAVLASTSLIDSQVTTGQSITLNFAGTSAELTSLVQGWLTFNLASQENPGLLFLDPSASIGNGEGLTRWVAFHHRTSPLNVQPLLTINFQPVPEPHSLALLGTGLAMLFASGRRKMMAALVSLA